MKTVKAKIKVNAFNKRLERATKILMILTNEVYPDDEEMTDACSFLTAKAMISDEIKDEFLKKLIGFYCYAMRNKIRVGEVLTVFFHDIGGIVNKEIRFLPRCDRYGIYYDPQHMKLSARELINQVRFLPK